MRRLEKMALELATESYESGNVMWLETRGWPGKGVYYCRHPDLIFNKITFVKNKAPYKRKRDVIAALAKEIRRRWHAKKIEKYETEYGTEFYSFDRYSMSWVTRNYYRRKGEQK